MFLTLLFLLIQAALYFHARNLAGTAAQEATAIASELGRSNQEAQSAGIDEANAYLDSSRLWQGRPAVTVTFLDSGGTVEAEVSGTVRSVLPFASVLPRALRFEVTERSERTVEMFRPTGTE